MKQTLGQHMLLEFYNCDPKALDDLPYVEEIMNQAARDCGATIVQSTFHRFQPHGISGVVVIAESHLAIHTWPEYRYASIDLYTCGDTIQQMVAYRVLKDGFSAEAADIQHVERGDLNRILDRLSPPAVKTAIPAGKEG